MKKVSKFGRQILTQTVVQRSRTTEEVDWEAKWVYHLVQFFQSSLAITHLFSRAKEKLETPGHLLLVFVSHGHGIVTRINLAINN